MMTINEKIRTKTAMREDERISLNLGQRLKIMILLPPVWRMSSFFSFPNNNIFLVPPVDADHHEEEGEDKGRDEERICNGLISSVTL